MFFKYITLLGDGIVIIIPVVAFLFFSLRHAVYLVTYLSTGLFTQMLKRLFFEDVIRPSRYFQDIASLHLVDGVKILAEEVFHPVTLPVHLHYFFAWLSFRITGT